MSILQARVIYYSDHCVPPYCPTFAIDKLACCSVRFLPTLVNCLLALFMKAFCDATAFHCIYPFTEPNVATDSDQLSHKGCNRLSMICHILSHTARIPFVNQRWPSENATHHITQQNRPVRMFCPRFDWSLANIYLLISKLHFNCHFLFDQSSSTDTLLALALFAL